MKNLLITGASAGIGYETVLLVGQRAAPGQYRFILVARRGERLEQLKSLLPNQESVVLPCDLGAPGAVQDLCQQLEGLGLPVDILVNNAGFGFAGRFESLSWANQLQMLNVNIVALTELTYRLLPDMKRRGQGHILNVGSVAGFLPGPYQALYYASKAFVNSLSLALEQELLGTGVAVTTLCPGPTSSEFQQVAGFADANKGSAMTAQQIAQEVAGCLESPGGIRIPGRSNLIAVHLMGFLPPRWRARLGGWLGRKRIANP